MLSSYISHISPARFALVIFTLVIILFTGLLMMPLSSKEGVTTNFNDALFTAVSSVCVTGLTTVSTAEHWSFIGQLTIITGIQVGGLGILTIASLLSLAVSKRLGVRGKLIAQSAFNQIDKLGEVGYLLKIVLFTSITIEVILFLFLLPTFIINERLTQAIWHSIFYSISAFNNAGFTLHSYDLMHWSNNLWVTTPIAIGVFIGSLGFPVIILLIQEKYKKKRWNLHTKLTINFSIILFIIGSLLICILEWNNEKTIGFMNIWQKLFNSFFHSIMTRSGGFSLINIQETRTTSRLIIDILMFIGGGSASTAGGIKVTTLAVLILAIFAEARGDKDMQIYGRTISYGTLRVAVSVTMMGAIMIALSTTLLIFFTNTSLDYALFESISAFATVGLSVGLSESISPISTYLLSGLMLAGRIGTITLASALALRHRKQCYHFPFERLIIG